MPHRLFQHHHNIDTYGHNYYASSSNRSTGSPTVTSNGGTVAGSGSPGLQNQVPGLGLGPIHTYSTHTTTTPRNSGKKYSIRLSHICLVLGFLLGLYVLFFRAVFKTDASEGASGNPFHIPRIIVYDPWTSLKSNVLRGSTVTNINAALRHIISEKLYTPDWMKQEEELLQKNWWKQGVESWQLLVNDYFLPSYQTLVSLTTGSSSKQVGEAKEDKKEFFEKGSFKTNIALWDHFPSSFSSKNLILGISVEVDVRNFAIFCSSLRKHDKTSGVVLFTTGLLTAKHKSIAQNNNIFLLSYNPASLREEGMTNMNTLFATTNNVQWLLYDWLLKQNLSSGIAINQYFENVLVVSVQETVFLRSPFTAQMLTSSDGKTKEEVVHGLVEVDTYTVGATTTTVKNSMSVSSVASNYNPRLANSIHQCFGERIMNLIHDQSLIHDQFFLGSTKEMVLFISKVANVLRGKYPCFRTQFPTCQDGISDGGIINVLVHMGHVEPLQLHHPSSYPVLKLDTFGSYVTHPEVRNEATGMISRATVFMDDPSATKYHLVLHYASDPIYYQSLLEEYAAFSLMTSASNIKLTPTEQTISDFIQTSTCHNYGVMMGIDILKGQCDSATLPASSMVQCCSICTEYSKSGGSCSAFTFSEGVCYLKHCGVPSSSPDSVNHPGGSELNMMLRYVMSNQFNDVNLLVPNAITGYIRNVHSK